MPELTFAPAISSSNSANQVGDARLDGTTGNPPPIYNVGAVDIGRITAGKTSANYGYVAHYDTSSIPIDATITKAKLEMRAHTLDTVATTIDVDVLGPDPRLNKNNETPVDGRMIYAPIVGNGPPSEGGSLWDNSSHTFVSTPSLRWYQDRRFGVRGYAQAWTANNPNNERLYRSWWMLNRDDHADWVTNNYDNLFRTVIYEAEGSPGNWRRGNLVNAGIHRSLWGAIPTASYESVFSWATATSGSLFYPIHGKTYISEIVFFGQTGGGMVSVAWDPSADGSSENVLTIAQDGKYRGDGSDHLAYHATDDTTVHRVQGFGETAAAFKSGPEIANMTGTGTQDSNIAFPSFAADTLYTMGHADYSPSGTLPNLTSNLNLALGNRSSLDDWIGIRMQDFTTTTANAKRKIWTSKGTTATRDSLYGLLLTLEWEASAGEKIYVTGSGTSKTSSTGEGISKASVEKLGTYGIETESPAGSGTSKTSIIGD